MLTAHFRPDGTLEAVDVDYLEADPAGREDLCDWVRLHKLDPARVPVQSRIDYDPATDEWAFPVYVPGAAGGIQIDRTTNEPVVHRVRRRVVAWTPRADRQPLRAA
jgi:hypothetical protein